MNEPFNNAGLFLVQTLFGLYILAVMLRFLLQWVRADFYNPLVQALVKITNPPLVPLRKFIPGLYGVDLAAVVLMFVLQAGELYLVANLVGVDLPAATVVLGAVAKIVDLLVNVFIWTIIIQAILSWVNPSQHHPAVGVLRSLTDPVLTPIRRVLPATGGLDLSPLVAIIVLYLLRILLVAPMLQVAGLPRGF